MTIVSVAQAAHRLGIDAKTLRRWCVQAQLPLHRHPGDGRTKGVSGEHLQVLARLHQRSLAPLPEESPADTSGEGRELPAALLTAPQQLDALQTQLAALGQQVAVLTHLLQQHAQPGSFGSAAPDQQAVIHACVCGSSLSSHRQNPCQAGAGHPARRVWPAGTLCGDLPHARRAPL